jgi:hypothetical protein
MGQFLPLLIGVVIIAILLLVKSRKKSDDSGDGSGQGYGSDMMVDPGRKRLYDAMRRYYLDEQDDRDGWIAFQFVEGLSAEGRKDRTLLVKRMSTELKIPLSDASQRLKDVVAAIQKVKGRSGGA